MKKLFAPLMICLLAVACTTSTTKTDRGPGTADSSSTHVALAYTTDEIRDWQKGSEANTQVAMAALKAFETNNISECVSYMADTVRLEFDSIETTLSRDSAATFLQQGRNAYKNMNIKMQDYESVRTPDGKEEYVSLWYKQAFTDNNGKADSVEVMNDIKLKNNKIVLINEKMRHYMRKM